MARDIKELHPSLQSKATELRNLCAKNGITIGISECFRSVAEQDKLYAQGRTTPGKIVTNAKGSTYSSQHQWGIAFDFYLIEDVDGDGKTSDDAFNNSTRIFDRVGQLAKSIGLGWGGDWRTPDSPHIYLPQWGNTTSQLKEKYGTFEKFKASWYAQPSTPKQTINNAVKEWQKSAMADGFSLPKYGADGKWGSECESVASKAIVKKRTTYKYPNLTKIVQKAVGASPVDGKCGNVTSNKIKAYQKSKSLVADGEVGLKTWKKILGV